MVLLRAQPALLPRFLALTSAYGLEALDWPAVLRALRG